MWIQIIGATGTGKEHVLNLIKKDGYELIGSPVVQLPENQLLQELNYAAARACWDVKAASLMERKDVVTIRSYYESRDIFVPTAFQMTQLTKAELEIFQTCYSFLDDEFFTPPDVVLFCKATKVNALNRAAMRGVQINDDVFNKQVELYDEYVKKIRVPVIELDSLADPAHVQKNLEFGISSIKTANLSSRSIWKRTMFWSKDVYEEKK